VVSLQVDSYLHREKTYGRIKVPVLKIVGYVEKAPYVALLDHAPKGADEPEQVALSSKPKPQYAAKYDPPAPADNAFAGFDPDDEINF
jgi:hypothetical protein